MKTSKKQRFWLRFSLPKTRACGHQPRGWSGHLQRMRNREIYRSHRRGANSGECEPRYGSKRSLSGSSKWGRFPPLRRARAKRKRFGRTSAGASGGEASPKPLPVGGVLQKEAMLSSLGENRETKTGAKTRGCSPPRGVRAGGAGRIRPLPEHTAWRDLSFGPKITRARPVKFRGNDRYLARLHLRPGRCWCDAWGLASIYRWPGSAYRVGSGHARAIDRTDVVPRPVSVSRDINQNVALLLARKWVFQLVEARCSQGKSMAEAKR